MQGSGVRSAALQAQLGLQSSSKWARTALQVPCKGSPEVPGPRKSMVFLRKNNDFSRRGFCASVHDFGLNLAPNVSKTSSRGTSTGLQGLPRRALGVLLGTPGRSLDVSGSALGRSCPRPGPLNACPGPLNACPGPQNAPPVPPNASPGLGTGPAGATEGTRQLTLPTNDLSRDKAADIANRTTRQQYDLSMDIDRSTLVYIYIYTYIYIERDLFKPLKPL